MLDLTMPDKEPAKTSGSDTLFQVLRDKKPGMITIRLSAMGLEEDDPEFWEVEVSFDPDEALEVAGQIYSTAKELGGGTH